MTTTQTEWLKTNKLEISPNLSHLSIRPAGSNVFWGNFYSVDATDDGKFTVVYHWCCSKFGDDAPCGKVVSTHSTLKAALRELISK